MSVDLAHPLKKLNVIARWAVYERLYFKVVSWYFLFQVFQDNFRCHFNIEGKDREVPAVLEGTEVIRCKAFTVSQNTVTKADVKVYDITNNTGPMAVSCVRHLAAGCPVCMIELQQVLVS